MDWGTGPAEVRLPADVASLLGAGGNSNLPIWLKPEVFIQPGFDAEACVADLRRFAPLSTLQSELQTYLAVLKSKMVEVINEDYQDYVSLSAKLVNVDGAVLRMRKPLLELKDKLRVLCEAVRGELAALGAGLRRRKEVALARGLLELMQELAHVASKVEKLLLEVGAAADPMGPGAGGGAGDLLARARLLERVAGEVSRLTFQANRGKDLAFVKAMEPRIAAARSQLQQALAVALQSALEQQAFEPALHCLHAYTDLGATEAAEAALRSQLVAPVVQRVLQDYKKAHPLKATAPGQGRDEGGLRQLLQQVDREVASALGSLLEAALTPQSPLRALDLLGNVVLHEVDTSLATRLPAVFSPGVPHAFHDNYLAAQAFLDLLEHRCQGRTALDRLRASPAYTSFNKRWNTSVYFSLHYQEVAGEVEDAAMQGRPELPPPSASADGAAPTAAAHVVLPISAAVIKGLTSIASPSVFLQPLADRFLKLALQLGQRYLTWAALACTARKAGAAAAAAHQQPGHPSYHASHSTPNLGAAGHRPTNSSGAVLDEQPRDGVGSHDDALAAAGTANVPPHMAWVAVLSLDDFSVLYSDLMAVAGHIRGDFSSHMLQRLSPALQLEDALAAVQGGLLRLADAVEAQAGSVLRVMCEEVSEACVGLVRQLKGITATYRMTTKGPPTRASHYVTSILGPLKALLEGPRASQLPAPVQQRLAEGVAEVVTSRYQVLAEELLVTVRKTESSLKRLKKVQQADTGDAGMSDSDKITLQLYLDVHEYGAQLSRFSVQPPSLPGFSKLLDAVTPPPQVLAAAGPSLPAGAAPAL